MTLRRDFLAFTAGAVAARSVLPLAVRAEGAHLDAALIAACGALPALLDAYNNSPEVDDDAERQELDACIGIIQNTSPATLAGMVAKARAAQAEAAGCGGFNTSVNDAEAWAWQLVGDLIRLAGGAA